MSARYFRSFAPFTTLASAVALAVTVSGCVNVITLAASPKTLIDRIIEARSAADIIKDNQIVLVVNGIMAKLGAFQASTEIYEQRLLITGLFDDKNLYDDFHSDVKTIADIKKLYWHARYLSPREQKQRRESGRLIGWADSLFLDTRIGLKLIGEPKVADVNYRVAADAFSHAYILGRARSKEELRIALKAARSIKTARKIVNYVIVRP